MMKRNMLLALAALVVAVVVMPLVAKEGAAKGKMASAQYMVISPHTAEQCLKALDNVSAAGTLAKWNFGCMDNDHTGYLMVSAATTEAALKSVPEDERAAARAVKLHRFTVAELKSFHEKMATEK